MQCIASELAAAVRLCSICAGTKGIHNVHCTHVTLHQLWLLVSVLLNDNYNMLAGLVVRFMAGRNALAATDIMDDSDFHYAWETHAEGHQEQNKKRQAICPRIVIISIDDEAAINSAARLICQRLSSFHAQTQLYHPEYMTVIQRSQEEYAVSAQSSCCQYRRQGLS